MPRLLRLSTIHGKLYGLGRVAGVAHAVGIAAWRLDLDDVGAEVGHGRGGHRPGDEAGGVEHAEAVEESLVGSHCSIVSIVGPEAGYYARQATPKLNTPKIIPARHVGGAPSHIRVT